MLTTHPVQTIVVALDGSDHAYKALDLAVDLASKYEARLVAVNAFTDEPLSDDELRLASVEYHTDILEGLNTESLMDVRGDPRTVAGLLVVQYADAARKMRRAIGKQLMNEARVRAKASGIDDIETFVEEGDPAALILRVAASRNADLIVLGSRGLSDLKGLLLGSVSHKVSQMSECTCITVK